ADGKYPRLVAVRDKIQRITNLQREIEELLQQAGTYRASGALLNPPGENAAELYHRVLATRPNNPIAAQGLSEGGAQLLSKATVLLAAGQIDKVREMNARALEIGLSDAALQALRAKLTAEDARIANVGHLLEEAQTLLADGYITEPTDKNAVARVLEVLRL